MSTPRREQLIGINPIQWPITHQDATRFVKEVMEFSGWPDTLFFSDFYPGELSTARKYEITFTPNDNSQGDIGVTVEYVPDEMLGTLSLRIGFRDVVHNDIIGHTYGFEESDQLKFLATLQRELDLRRCDENSVQRQKLRENIDRLRLKLRASQRVEYLLAMHDPYDQLGELGANRVEVSQGGWGGHNVRIDGGHERWHGQSWKFNRVLDAAKLPWEAFVAAGTPVDSVTVALDLTCNPGGLSRETLYTQLHELAGH